MKTKEPIEKYLRELNAAQDAFTHFEEGDAEAVCRNLKLLRPYGYIAVHSSGQCRVMKGEGCLTPLRAIAEGKAVEFALSEGLQTNIRLRLDDHVWFLQES